MVSVTETTCGLLEAADEEMITFPEYVPGTRVPGLTETATLVGVLPDEGDAESQEPPENDMANVNGGPVLPIETA